jgi:hypothetical protein
MKNSWGTMQAQGAFLGYRYFFSIENGNEGALLISNVDSYRDRIEENIVKNRKIEKPIVNNKSINIEEHLSIIERKLDQIIMFFKNNKDSINT